MVPEMHSSPSSRTALGILLAGGLTVLLVIVYLSGPSLQPSPHVRTFVIMADDNGFNGSVQHALPWPVITVHLGDNVTIEVINDGKVESHGFAIDNYYPQGLIVAPGETQQVSFTANVAGNFTFYCNIFCTVHQYMIGQLVVVK